MIRQAKCPNCGAFLSVVDGKVTTAKCEYCGTPFVKGQIFEETTKSTQSTGTTATPPPSDFGDVFKEFTDVAANAHYHEPSKHQDAPPRPKLSIGTAIILSCFYVFPGILYVALTLFKQYSWDKHYGN